MKTVLVLKGSARKDSVSSLVSDKFTECADEKFNVKTYNAYALNPKPCYGCGACGKEKKCINRDLDEFFADFEQADYFVISTPVYNSSVPSPLKAIVDRFQLYYALRFEHGIKPPVAKHKKAALIISAGSNGEGREEIEKMFRRQFTVLNTALEATVFVDSTDTKPITEESLKEAQEKGKIFFK